LKTYTKPFEHITRNADKGFIALVTKLQKVDTLTLNIRPDIVSYANTILTE
jgi:hypothetical protein